MGDPSRRSTGPRRRRQPCRHEATAVGLAAPMSRAVPHRRRQGRIGRRARPCRPSTFSFARSLHASLQGQGIPAMPQPCDPSDRRATRAAFQPDLDTRGLAAGWQEFFEIMTNWVLRTSGGSSIIFPRDADVAQLVEHDLAKVGVAGSNPVVRSIVITRPVILQSFGRPFP